MERQDELKEGQGELLKRYKRQESKQDNATVILEELKEGQKRQESKQDNETLILEEFRPILEEM